jgi:nitrous oxide reductase accessory protein NosL
MLKFKLFLFSFVIFLFLGCEKEVQSGPAKINWDRDMCDRCVMVLSDRKNTVQLKHPQTKKVYKFDDIGCMVLWFNEENIDFKDSAEIWITDANSGEWCNARTAFYTTQNITPMAFGFSAYKSKESIKAGEEILTYEEVLKKIK